MKKFLLVSICLLGVLSFTGCKKSNDLSTLSTSLNTYKIVLDYDNDTKSASAYEKLTYTNTSPDALWELKFHLYPKFFTEGNTKYIISEQKMANLYPNGISNATFNITRVQVDTLDKPYSYEGDCDGILVINLDNALLPNKTIDIKIDFDFTLPNCSHRFGYLDHTINLNNFYPVICVYENGEFNTSPYNSNGDPFYSEISNYNVTLTCDSALVVASSGVENDTTTSENKTTHSLSAICVRDFGLVLSPNFSIITEKHKDITINYYYYDDTDSEGSLKSGVDAIKTFSELFGPYPYSTYSIVQSDFVFGGMEYPALVMISDEVTDPIDYKNVIIHETAHQWWYGLVGNDEYAYPWLDEALAEYSTALFYEENEGYELTCDDMMTTTRENYSLFVRVYQDVFGTIDTSMRAVNKFNTEPEYTYITYVKGTLMYDSLSKLIGTSTLIKGLKEYYQAYKFQFATPNDLISTLSSSSGKDLTGFFSSWLNGKVIIN